MAKDIVANLKKLAGGESKATVAVAPQTRAAVKTQDWDIPVEDLEDEDEDEVREYDEDEAPAEDEADEVQDETPVHVPTPSIDTDALARKVADHVIAHLRNALNYLPQD